MMKVNENIRNWYNNGGKEKIAKYLKDDPKYETEYRGNDLAIFPTYRRRAFLVARDGKYIEEKKGLFVDNIYKLLDKVDLNDYRTVIPAQQIVDLVEKEMPNGSEVCASVKKFVETKLGIVSKRGCRYSYLIKIVAAVLETVYKADYTIVECRN